MSDGDVPSAGLSCGAPRGCSSVQSDRFR